MSKNIFVIGHKNPDTDSICASLAYAWLKQRQGEVQVIAARAGNINPQTEFVLNFFNVPSPTFLPNVVPKVGQAMTKEVLFRHKETVLNELLQLMEENNIRLIPIVDEQRRYYGTVSLFDIAHEFYGEVAPQSFRKIFTSVKHLYQVLGGELLYSRRPRETFEGIFIVGAMRENSFGNVLSTIDPQKCIVITGDRTEIQQAAIQSGVRALIVTGGLPVGPGIYRKAEEREVSLLTSPYDTATTVGLVRLSIPAYRVAQKEDGYLPADEPLERAQQKILNTRNRGMIVLDEQERLMGIITRADLLRFSKTKLILVDHNEISQAVDGADQAEIVEIIDHHRLANPQTLQPILFINQPVGSTCTLIAKFYFDQQVKLDYQKAGLLLSGIISDTLNLKSPTATLLDKQMLERLNQIAKLDLAAYVNRLFQAGTSLSGRSPEELILGDFKEYKVGKVTFGVGQVEVIGFTEFYRMKSELIEQIVKIRQARDYQFAALMVTDISTSSSLLAFDGRTSLCNRLNYHILEPHVAELKGLLSRKKQLLPHLLNVFKEAEPK